MILWCQVRPIKTNRGDVDMTSSSSVYETSALVLTCVWINRALEAVVLASYWVSIRV